MPHPVTWLDVFSAEPFSGNQLAVVHEADDLDEAAMLALARETRLSETTFVQAPTGEGADYRNRIFWSKGELPFAGHPSLGTAVAVADRAGESQARYVQQTPAGLQPVEVDLGDDGRARASMLQEPANFGEELDPQLTADAVGLQTSDLDEELVPQVVSTGVGHVLLPVRDERVLERCLPSAAVLSAVLDAHDAATLYVAAARPDIGYAAARAFFVEAGGFTEDPATGSAAGPLCAYLAARAGGGRLIVDQGVAMGRPSRIEAEPDGERIRVSGDVVVIARGELLT